jgi:hypothetical protein
VTKRRSSNAEATEAAWARLVAKTGATPPRTPTVAGHLAGDSPDKKIDGRSLRKTGRTEQFNVRVKAETRRTIQSLADANDWLIAEVIERAVAALEEKLAKQA